MRATREEYERINLRAHSLLADIPLHDVWAVELSGGGPGRTIVDLRALLSVENLMAANRAVRFLFWLLGWLGRVFGWDRARSQSFRESPLLGHLRSPGGSHYLGVHATHRSRPPRDCLSRRTAYHQRDLGARCTHWAV